MSHQDHDLVARLERLERENRRVKRVVGGLLAGVGALALVSFAAPTLCKTVTAERLVIHDERGKERMVVNAYATRTPSLTFKDASGAAAARLSIDDAGTLDVQVFKNGEPTDASFRLQPVKGDEKGGAVD